MESFRQAPRTSDASMSTSPPSRFVDLMQTKVPARAEQFMARLYGEHALRLRDSTALDMRMQGFQLVPGVNYPELSATTIVSGAVGR